MDLGTQLLAAGHGLLDQLGHPGPFRLVGMAAFDLERREGDRQTDLFEDAAVRNLEIAIDDLCDRFGQGAVTRARDLAAWGTVASRGVNLDYLDLDVEPTQP